MKFSPQGVSLNEQKTEALKEFITPRDTTLFFTPYAFQFTLRNVSKDTNNIHKSSIEQARTKLLSS